MKIAKFIKFVKIGEKNIMSKLKEFIAECGRVIRVTRKPTKDEFWTTAKVAAIGLLVIGLVGFILHISDKVISLTFTALIVVAIVIFLLLMKE